ncbi:hypothetical protein XA68_10142 [Ophiocordyceps unilateralis]|uniref:Cytochrome P450 n=1 Tax=Ophiocordyceps unilateralis TaxID=268505 RepID=A0A2A9PJ30_OPHUN|nr:hypothetical protein XA68_10142 [Ophiocordyceps unilateralis]
MATAITLLPLELGLHRFVDWPVHHALGVGVVVAVLGLLGSWTLAYLTSPLRHFPGPFLAGWTNLWRLALVCSNNYTTHIKQLHERHGAVVRIGPNTLDVDAPELIKTLYGTDGKWAKTDFYRSNSVRFGDRLVWNVFSEANQARHAAMKRPMVKYFSSGVALEKEPLVDDIIASFCHELDARFALDGGPECDLGAWVAFCAWDILGVVTLSKDFGYLEKGYDHDCNIKFNDRITDYFAFVGQMPFLGSLLEKMPLKRIGPPLLENVASFALRHIRARAQGRDDNFNPAVPDFLQHFLDAKAARPDLVDDELVFGYVLVTLLAGADTTAIAIRAVFYFILKHRRVWDRLADEVLAAGAGWEGVVAPYSAARALPYLEAVVRESLRLHPSVGMLLERRVPDGGLTLPDGRFVPENTEIGINPLVANRNRAVWGPDADEFRPERWLPQPGESPDDDAFRDRLRRFNAADLTFGGGARVCIGRNFAYLEIYKIVATLIRRYHIELVHPDRDWNVSGSWFRRQKGIVCRFARRSG